MRQWWSNPRIPLSSVNRLRLAWITVLVTLIGWPVSAVLIGGSDLGTQFILALSWLAITLTAIDALSTADVRAEQDR